MAGRVELSAAQAPTPRQTRPGVLPLAYSARGRQPETEKLLSDSTILRISTALQSSLLVENVIRTFAAEIRRLLPKISLRYNNKAAEIKIEDGHQQLHRSSYELNLVGDSLGEIAFLRHRPFTDKEEALLEVLLCALVYPLRNALLYQQALQQALKDPLTGVNNRASLDAYLKHQVLVTQRHGNPLSVIMIDVDKFKGVNDSYGHLVGDVVLRKVANAIVRCTRDSDMVFRFGGEEFVAVLSNTELEGAHLLAERIRLYIETMGVDTIGSQGKITVSAGVAELKSLSDPVQLLERCDELLYRAKANGRNRVESDLLEKPNS